MTSRRAFFQTFAAVVSRPALGQAGELDGFQIARRHQLVTRGPSPGFFEGMLLGNGDIGLCVVCRPDALGLHLGKLDVWDIRVSDDHIQHVLPFDQLMAMWKRASERARQAGQPLAIFLERTDPELSEYVQRTRSSYARPWPRPWPCGTVWLHWDARKVTIKRQQLDISRGLYRMEASYGDWGDEARQVWIECFVHRDIGYIALAGNVPVVSVAYYPHTDSATEMPAPELSAQGNEFACLQWLPATPPEKARGGLPRTPDDRSFTLEGWLEGNWESKVTRERRLGVWMEPRDAKAIRLDLALVSSLDAREPRAAARQLLEQRSSKSFEVTLEESARSWRQFWQRSAVEFEDQELERIWYHNQYFLACTLKPGKPAPGLFGNWMTGNIGTAWHGDYHMNYNTQQVFWGVFSSNHPEQHLPYIELVEKLLPMARWNAQVMFGLPGAYFPHSAYPVPSNVNPYPVPPWGYEICETPWTVQSLWWHYLYTQDEQILRRIYPLLKAAAEFLLAYAKKEADGKYHLNPTVSPENWGFTVDQRLNRDCIIDIALAEFLLDAVVEASKLLNRDPEFRQRCEELRQNLPAYPEVTVPYGRVWADVAGAPAEHVYNVPVTTSPVFPGEQVGLDRRAELLDLARRTAETVRLEGGNDLVWLPLVRARLGVLDLEWFKREVRYCRLPNGTAGDRVRQIGGRYTDQTDFDFMMHMGVWVENLALPAVLNECLLQSYAGVIRVFPNPPRLCPARFHNLRAVGAFLVSAAWDGHRVRWIRIFSERGRKARVVKPWPQAIVRRGDQPVEARVDGPYLVFATEPGATYELLPA